MLRKGCYNGAVNKPVVIGPILGLVVLVTGCAKRNPENFELIGPSTVSGTIESPIHQVSTNIDLEKTNSLPIDEEARASGKKVFSKVSASLRRSPRDNAPETYRVSPGTALYVRRTDDNRWLEVRLSKGRSAYVKTDETTALALALAQGSLADQQRLTPRTKQDQQVDAGDGNSGGVADRDPALDGAISDAQESFAVANEASDRFRAEVGAFQTPNSDWIATRDACLQQLSALATAMQDFADELRSVTALSSSLNAQERAAYQSIVVHQGEVTDSINSCRQTLNQMGEGSDWVNLIEAVLENSQSLAGAIDGVRVNLAKLG